MSSARIVWIVGLQLIGAFTSTVNALDESKYEWRLVTTTAPWMGRDGAGILSYRGELWLLGGWNPGNRSVFPMICTNDVWSSKDGASWSLVKPNTFKDRAFDTQSDWEGRHTAGYAVYRDKMWIIGGDCNQKHYQNDVWNSTDGKNWSYVNKGKDVPWGPRVLHYTVVHQDKLWVMGGQTMPGFVSGDEKFYRDIWTSTDGVEWQEIIPKEPFWSPRGMIGGSAVMNGRIWILGGGTYDTPTTPQRKFYNDVWSSADGIDWTLHTREAPWHPRQYHDVAVWENQLWVMEGYHQQGGNRNDVWYSADGIHWTELAHTPWKPRHAASLVVHNGSLWMIAGNNMQPDVWQLTSVTKN
ncbi:MAG: hypothetical protein ABL921_00100 [Pirellula sp.]